MTDRPDLPWGAVFLVLRREAADWSNADVAVRIGLIPADADPRTRARARKDVARWTLPGRSWSQDAPPWAVRKLASLLGRALVVLGDEVAVVDEAVARKLLAAEERR